MTSRISRKTTVTTTTSSSEGGTSTTAAGTSSGSATSSGYTSPYSSPRRGRAPSPVRLSRIQEKEKLQSLNDRLANYIDRVRTLENENNRLMVKVRSSEETVSREVTNTYETELTDTKKLLEEIAKEKARFQIESGKYKAEADEWRTNNKAIRLIGELSLTKDLKPLAHPRAVSSLCQFDRYIRGICSAELSGSVPHLSSLCATPE